jgi:hypothetical protein
MLINGDPDEPSTLPPGQSEDEALAEFFAWFEKWSAAGKVLDGGAELEHPSTARTVRGGTGGPVVTDGPYMELKEVIGGVVLLEAADLDEAVAVAATWPSLRRRPSLSIEVRPVVER